MRDQERHDHLWRIVSCDAGGVGVVCLLGAPDASCTVSVALVDGTDHTLVVNAQCGSTTIQPSILTCEVDAGDASTPDASADAGDAGTD
jgi:hypothetical protein